MSTTKKSPAKSKTVWGGIILSVLLALNALGVDIAPEEAQGIAEGVGALVGLVLVIWGRYSAKQPLTNPASGFAFTLLVLPTLFLLMSCAQQPNTQGLGSGQVGPSRTAQNSGLFVNIEQMNIQGTPNGVLPAFMQNLANAINFHTTGANTADTGLQGATEQGATQTGGTPTNTVDTNADISGSPL